MKHKIRFLFFIASIVVFSSCGDRADNPVNDSTPAAEVPKFEMLTISVDESNVNTLMILLAKDGTINRKGTLADTSDHDFFMGITREPFFDNVDSAITTELLSYCSLTHPECDTTIADCKVELSFSSGTVGKNITYCVEGSFDQLPAPIRNYILNAQRITDPWHKEQTAMVQKNNPR